MTSMNMRGATLREQYEAKVDRSGGPDACHPWTAALNTSGYGKIATRSLGRTSMSAHRVGWYLAHGSMPTGTVDHTCHNTDPACAGGVTCPHRACQNPAHWEDVPDRVNVARGTCPPAVNARKTHCVAGHELTSANTYRSGGNVRRCKICGRRRQRESRAASRTPLP